MADSHYSSPAAAAISSTNTTTVIPEDETFAFLNSPVPLSAQEADSEAVRALALRLAPTLCEADEVLQVSLEELFQPSHDDDDADAANNNDDLDFEEQSLVQSEAMLRQELSLLSQDFANLFSYDDDDSDNDHRRPQEDGIQKQQQQEQQEPADYSSYQTPQKAKDENLSIGTTVNAITTPRLSPIPIPPRTPPNSFPDNSQHHFDSRSSSVPATATLFSLGDSFFAQERERGAIHYTADDHAQKLQLRKEERGGWYSIDLSRHLVDTATGTTATDSSTNTSSPSNTRSLPLISDAVKEYCVAIPEVKLRQMLVGLPEPVRQIPVSRTVHSPPKTAVAEPLPVRTISLRIRPDVLVGSVMEAVHHALADLQCALIIKRQGGHCQAVIRETKYHSLDDNAVSTLDGGNDDDDGFRVTASSRETDSVITYRPFFVDVRLCTNKSDACERLLLVRMYHSGSVQVQSDDPAASPSREELLEVDCAYLARPIDATGALHLRESAALIQLLEGSNHHLTKKLSGTPRHLHRHDIEQLVSAHLLQHYRACPSVQGGGITLPALNAEDYQVIHSSWRLTQALWEELETRDLTYTTLVTSRFGAFPALPSLDVHYCSQLRRWSREQMVSALLKAAAELEDFAREAELACASLITLLRPAFEAYQVEAPSLPRATALTEYPLEFVLPQTLHPPFGLAVQHALNQVQARASEAASHDQPLAIGNSFSSDGGGSTSNIDAHESLTMAADAVQWVMNAFRQQDDEEQSARLQRKNVQVLDRLAKMQAHQKLLIQILENSHRISAAAAQAAQTLEQKTGIRGEVPLLKWSIVTGRATTGTCTVTAHHVAFVTQLIPMLGMGNSVSVFAFDEVEFAVTGEAQNVSLLNPLPTVITVTKQGQEVYRFRPSIGGARLKSFLDGVRAAALLKEPLTLPDNPSSRISLPDEMDSP